MGALPEGLNGLDTLAAKKEANKRGRRAVPVPTPPDVTPAATPPPAPKLIPAPQTTAPAAAAAPSGYPVSNAQEGSPDIVPDGRPGWAPLHRFTRRPDNPRWDEEYDPEQNEALDAMSGTVADHGVLQAVTACSVDAWVHHRPEDKGKFGPEVWYIVLQGNRRLTTAELNKLEGLSFTRRDDLADPTKAVTTGLIENFHRSALDPIREAMEMKKAMDLEGIPSRVLADRLKTSHGTINQRVKLLKLIPEFKQLVALGTERGGIGTKKGQALADLSEDEQHRLYALGAPFNPAQLNRPKPQPAASSGPVTTAEVRIPKQSGVVQVAELLRAKMPAELLDQVLKYFETGEAQDEPA